VADLAAVPSGTGEGFGNIDAITGEGI